MVNVTIVQTTKVGHLRPAGAPHPHDDLQRQDVAPPAVFHLAGNHFLSRGKAPRISHMFPGAWFLPSNIGLSCKFSNHPILWHVDFWGWPWPGRSFDPFVDDLLSDITIQYTIIPFYEQIWVNSQVLGALTQGFLTHNLCGYLEGFSDGIFTQISGNPTSWWWWWLWWNL